MCRRSTVTLAVIALIGAASALLLVVPPAAADVEPPYLWETEFGSTGGGPGQLSGPRGMAVGPDGELYVVDGGNDRIQVLDRDGAPLDEFGVPQQPVVGATPDGITTDGTTIWVADRVNSRVLRYAMDGSLLGQFGSFGTDPGQTQQPSAVAADGLGNVYVTGEATPDRVQRFDGDGDLLDVLGSTGSGPGQLNTPLGVAVGPSGDVYVADHGNNRVQVFDAEGDFVRGWPSPGPTAIAVGDDERVFVLRTSGVVEVTTYDSDGTELTDWSNFFDNPAALAVDATGDVFVTESALDRIQRFGVGTFPTGESLVATTLYQSGLVEDTAVAADGSVYATVDNCCGPGAQARVQVFAEDGTPGLTWGSTGAAPGQLNDPQAIDIGPDGSVYVVERGNDRVQRFAPDGTLLDAWGGLGTGDGQFTDPIGVTVADDGVVYVGDTGNRRIQVFEADGTYLDQFTVPTPASRPFAPTGLDLGPDGDLYVADAGTHRVRVLEVDGDLVRQFGQLGDDPGTLSTPWGIAVDDDGAIWVASLNVDVQQFSPSGQPLRELAATGGWVTTDGPDVLATGFGARRHVPAAPAVSISVDILQDTVIEGDPVDLEVTVTNTGNTTLSEVTVTDSGAPDCAATFESLAVGAVEVIECGHTIPVGSLTFLDGIATFSNTAQVDTAQTSPVTSAAATVQVQEERFALTVTKSDPGESGAVGTPLSFDIEVTNSGNRPVTGLTLSDPDATCGPLSATELAPSDQASASCSHTTTEDDIGVYTNVATVDSDQTAPTPSNEVDFLVTDPSLAVTAAARQSSVTVGDAIEVDLTIENTGDVELTGLVVTTPSSGCESPGLTLAAGATADVTCSFVASPGDVPAFGLTPTVSTDQLGAVDGNAVEVAVAHRVRPDAQARVGSGPFVGNGRYNTTGAQQARSSTVPPGGRATFTVRAQNDGSTTAGLAVRGAGSTSRYTVTYRQGGTVVTNRVLNGTFRFTDVPAGASRDLTVTIQARNGTPRGAALTRLVTVSSTTSPAVRDAVKLTVTRR